MTDAVGRRRFLVALGGSVVSGCSAKSSSSSAPPCATPADGPGLPYCLVAKSRLRVPGGARLTSGQVLIMSIDDSSAAIVARDDRGLYALSAICTHACCLVNVCGGAACSAPVLSPDACGAPLISQLARTGAAFLCPCHGSQFAADGAPIAGPAKVPLPSLGLEVSGADLVVDLSRAVSSSDRVST